MKVLLSIKREFADKIFNGSKKYEFRRKIFKKSDVDTVVVYASGTGGAIVGEFQIEEILHHDLDTLWNKTSNQAGISEATFKEYFADKNDGYAIGIKKTTIYNSPLPLRALNLRFPPQSFAYLNFNIDSG
jgi:predicted transcriptional regulator